MSKPAIRNGDVAGCPIHDLGVATRPVGSVHVNAQPLMTFTGVILCGGSVDAITTGSATVAFGKLGVATTISRTQHGSTLGPGSSNVFVGGPSVGGSPALATSVCQGLAAGRAKNRQSQSYDNCGLESCRQMINHGRPPNEQLSEDSLLDYAIDSYLASAARKKRGLPAYSPDQSKEPPLRQKSGGTGADEQVAILKDHGIPAEAFDQSPEAIVEGVESGKGVLVGVYPDILWQTPGASDNKNGKHAILVTGVVRDAQGRVTAYLVNDTGKLGCGVLVPAQLLDRALLAKGVMTKSPLWTVSK
jgi:uncharacterized Zn-binding protein involved in type VI secretion